MRTTTRALTRHYIDLLDLGGDVLEIGGRTLSNCAIGLFQEPRFRYHDLDLVASDIPNTILADITDCADVIPDSSFDVWPSGNDSVPVDQLGGWREHWRAGLPQGAPAMARMGP